MSNLRLHKKKGAEPTFTSTAEMDQSFYNKELALRSVGKFRLRTSEVARDFCCQMVEYGR